MAYDEVYRAQALRAAFYQEYPDFSAFLEPGFDAIGVHSNSTLIAVNDRLVEVTGYAREELEGINAWKLFSPQSIELIQEKLMKKATEPYEVYARRKDLSLQKLELKGINFFLGSEPLRAVLVRLID